MPMQKGCTIIRERWLNAPFILRLVSSTFAKERPRGVLPGPQLGRRLQGVDPPGKVVCQPGVIAQSASGQSSTMNGPMSGKAWFFSITVTLAAPVAGVVPSAPSFPMPVGWCPWSDCPVAGAD